MVFDLGFVWLKEVGLRLVRKIRKDSLDFKDNWNKLIFFVKWGLYIFKVWFFMDGFFENLLCFFG